MELLGKFHPADWPEPASDSTSYDDHVIVWIHFIVILDFRITILDFKIVPRKS